MLKWIAGLFGQKAAARAHIERTPSLLLAMSIFTALNADQQRLVRSIVDLAGIADTQSAKDAAIMLDQMGVTMDAARAVANSAGA